MQLENAERFKALKEAVINAIVHNDYSYGNSPIIELYSDRIEITSAGGLPQELSQEEFLEGCYCSKK